ncbi:ABC transporter substrate-binding protein [Nitratireductor aquimarinus]|uniref:ABC transporter substrate-binding protein n=1 Tax=Nitratireductor aquimarinus TaxID=889300 RepID=A0ABU4AHY3_9HYPH|nr:MULTISPECIES: ABC transporter substrate-binding protein [Nitratireductor]MBN7762440.1 amino acid ABC transporter substrate-binding protein [Nitratireductor aquibiodomus]MCV0352502.1 ABC transporter substrate-binding protein [Nitratireductor sp.]MDJ1464124.1 ABC transporter substrate-binding protein [Nitratireductor sp. GZWM139]MDV2968223.1 ABC transporter substrate-binding protein [Nitratireductor aquimarinus]MDV6225741.1 ABC transporter substrate-binding protein [Nitratireductor aquimarinu
MSLNGFFTNRRGLIGLGAAALIAASAAWAPASAETPTYKVGSTPTGVPFTFLDVKSNKISGVMVDIITAIGEEEGFTPDVKATQWSALIPSLTSDKIDIIAAAMYATEERAKVVDFTDTVYSYGEGLFVSKDDETEYKTPQDLEGKTVGVQVGTAYIEPMKALGVFKEVKIYDSIPDIMRDVQLGRIDAGFGDRPIVAYQLSQGAANVRLVKSYDSTITGDVAMSVKPGNDELRASLNEGLKKIKASGKLDEILTKWGLN